MIPRDYQILFNEIEDYEQYTATDREHPIEATNSTTPITVDGCRVSKTPEAIRTITESD